MFYPRSALARKSRTPDEQIGKHHSGAFVPPEHSGRLGETVLNTHAFARAHIHKVPRMCIFVGDLSKKIVESGVGSSPDAACHPGGISRASRADRDSSPTTYINECRSPTIPPLGVRNGFHTSRIGRSCDGIFSR